MSTEFVETLQGSGYDPRASGKNVKSMTHNESDFWKEKEWNFLLIIFPPFFSFFFHRLPPIQSKSGFLEDDRSFYANKTS